MKSLLKYLYSIAFRVLLLPFSLCKIRRERLVFTGLTGGSGYDYSGNPRYLSDFIQKQEPGKFDIYWMVTGTAFCKAFYGQKLLLSSDGECHRYQRFLCTVVSVSETSVSDQYLAWRRSIQTD